MIAGVALLLAIIAFVRLSRLERDVRALRARIRALDEAAATDAGAAARSSATLAPAPPASPDPTRASIPADITPMRSAAPVASPSLAARGIPAEPAGGIAAGEPPDAGETLERRIGGRLLLYAGMVVLVLGVAFFLRYAFDREWISPLVRVVAGGAAGFLLAVAGLRLARSGFQQYGRFLCGGGLAMMFLSVYAAYAFYALVGQAPAFGMLAAIAAGAAVLADQEASLPLAVMAVLGGFATPFLVGGRSDAQPVLFSYDAALVAATMFLAHRRSWPWLNFASLLLTIITIVAWATVYYTPAKYLRTELFLTLFCALFAGIFRETRRSHHRDAGVVSALLVSGPVLYHAASIVILFDHHVALPVYLLVASAAIVVASIEIGSSVVRLVGWLAVLLPLLYYSAAAGESRLWSAVISALGVWLIVLANHVRLALRGDALDGADVALLHGSGISAYVGMYGALASTLLVREQAQAAAALAVANLGLSTAFRTRPAAAHWLGVAFSLAAISIAIGLEGYWTVVMWAAEAVALVWVGVRADRNAFRVAALALFAVALGHWLQSAAPSPTEPFVPLLHARALSGLAAVGLLYGAGWLMRGPRVDGVWLAERGVILVAASALTVTLVSLDIHTYWARQLGTADARLAMHLMLSAWWAIYAAALVVAGMWRHYAPVRYFAMVLFGVTLLKVFLVDLQQLAGIYRVVAFLVVGIVLLLVSLLYQRARADR